MKRSKESLYAEEVTLNGLKLSAKEPLTPRTLQFLSKHNMQADRRFISVLEKVEVVGEGGKKVKKEMEIQKPFLVLSQNFPTFTSEEVRKFLMEKAYLDSKVQAVSNTAKKLKHKVKT